MTLPPMLSLAAIRAMPKRTLFIFLLGVAGLIAALVSLIAHFAFLRVSLDHPVKIAVIAPMSGSEKEVGDSIRRGAELFVKQTNKKGGMGGRPLAVLALDESSDPAIAAATAQTLAAAEDVIGVVGHWQEAGLSEAGKIYAASGVPALVLAGGQGSSGENKALFRTTFDDLREVRFLANYVRNVTGEKTVSIIQAGNEANDRLATAFDEVMQRFGTKVLFKWRYDTAPAAGAAKLDDQLKAIIAEVKDKKLIGAVLVLGDTESSAQVVAALREAGLRNRVVGMRNLATRAFVEAMNRNWKGQGSVQAALNGTLVTTPMLFDTAGELAQSFRNAYIDSYRAAPDWPAAYAYDAVKLMAHGYPHGSKSVNGAPASARPAIQADLAKHASLESAFPGLNGPLFFDAANVASSPAMAGTYDGSDLIAALTQLSPIRDEGVANYLEELVAGRALYVNDRFMYKTSVVYSGLRIEKITGLDAAANMADVEFVLWFRWRGGVEPQDVVFTNAVAPIKLDKPERQGQDGDMLYRSYRVRAKFYLNYSGAARAYGTNLIGVSFHHRTLSSNNLMYVGDLLGMNLAGGVTLAERLREADVGIDTATGHDDGASVLTRLASLVPGMSAGSADPLVELLNRAHVLAGINGWGVERAWLSQEVAVRGTEGDPLYVGFGKPKPNFSLLDMGMVVKPDTLDARDFIAEDLFVYIAIFSLVGALLAALLDRKDRGQFWRLQTLGLRLVAWPFMLISLGNLARDYALHAFATSTVDTVVLFSDILWWLVPARLAAIFMERFVWVPLETRTGRKIPNVVRIFSSGAIYLFAIFGVIAFVMGKTITSLLATSGLMAMLIGLAIQSNLRDVFSGIVLNIERPFGIGDFIKINNVIGEVIDITWRTTRIRHDDGQIVSLPNGKTSDAEIHNFSKARCAETSSNIYVPTTADPQVVIDIIKGVLPGIKHFFRKVPDDEPTAQYVGVECVGGHWVSRFKVSYKVLHMGKKQKAVNDMWVRLWELFRAAGIEWKIPESEDDMRRAALASEKPPALAKV